MLGMIDEEFYKCPKCGEEISKHKFFFEGCREHVERYSGTKDVYGKSRCEKRCSTKHCELNHKCK